MIMLLVEIFFKAFLLFTLLYIVARDEADFEFRKVTMVTAGIILGAVIIDATLTRVIHLFTLIPIAAFTVFMIIQFCWVRFWRSLLVAIPFLIMNIMISMGVTSFNQKANAAVARGLRGPISDDDVEVALSFYKDELGTNQIALIMNKKPPPKTEEMLDQVLLKKFSALFTSALKPSSPAAAGVEKGKLIKPAGVQSKSPPKISEDSRPTRVAIGKTEPGKGAPGAAVSDADWQEAGSKINAKGILIGNDGIRVAIVNNQIFKEGEYIQVEHRGTIYRWRLKFIRGGGISWEPVEAISR